MSDMDDLANLPPDPEQFVPDENLANKGDFFDIRKKIPTLREIRIGAGWDTKIFEEKALDVDLSCFMLNRSDQTREDSDFIFYNQEKALEGAVRHQGDSRTGAGDGDDEIITIDLNGVPFDILKIVFVLTIYEGPQRGQDFGMVRNMYLRMVNDEDDNEIFRFKMPESDYKGYIGIKVGELVREGPKWYFSVLGENIPGGLEAIATQYGLIIQM